MSRRIDMTDLERNKLADAGKQSIPCNHGWRTLDLENPPSGEFLVLDSTAQKHKIKIAYIANYGSSFGVRDRYGGLLRNVKLWQPLPKEIKE